MMKYNKIPSKMYKQLAQQIVQQKMQHKVQQQVHNNYVALLSKQFVFNKLVGSLYYELEYSVEDVIFIFRLFSKTKTQRKFNFSRNFTVQNLVHFVVHIAVECCAVLWISLCSFI